MAKKRRRTGEQYNDTRDRNLHADASKFTINTFEDVADSEDEFHINRDKILLEEKPAHKRQRRLYEDGKLAQAIILKRLCFFHTDVLQRAIVRSFR